MNHHRGQRLNAGFSPKEYLRGAERHAAAIQGHLKVRSTQRWVPKTGVAMENAEALAKHIENLSKYGQRVNAEEATKTVEIVQVLAQALSMEIDALLGSGSQQA